MRRIMKDFITRPASRHGDRVDPSARGHPPAARAVRFPGQGVESGGGTPGPSPRMGAVNIGLDAGPDFVNYNA